LQWRKDGGEEASQLWQSLGANNSKIFNLIQELLVQMNVMLSINNLKEFLITVIF
jgi:hypothetical protein